MTNGISSKFGKPITIPSGSDYSPLDASPVDVAHAFVRGADGLKPVSPGLRNEATADFTTNEI